MADFETKCEQHALDYIKIHLREGYYVTAYVDKGTYYWEKVYKVHAYKKSDDIVRCAECIYSNGVGKYCQNDYFVKEDTFCSYGKREGE